MMTTIGTTTQIGMRLTDDVDATTASGVLVMARRLACWMGRARCNSAAIDIAWEIAWDELQAVGVPHRFRRLAMVQFVEILNEPS